MLSNVRGTPHVSLFKIMGAAVPCPGKKAWIFGIPGLLVAVVPRRDYKIRRSINVNTSQQKINLHLRKSLKGVVS